MGRYKEERRAIVMDTQSIERAYSFYSGFYDLVWNKIFHQSRREAVQLLNLQGGERILDVGVGTGLSLLFYPTNCQVIGIDLCNAMLEKGRERTSRHGLSHIELHEMDAMKMSFEDNSFDAVLAAYTISTVPDPSRVIDEMIRVSKKNGKIVLLNHFKNDNPFISSCETMISPLTKQMGFRADLELSTLFSGKPVMVEKILNVKPLNYWEVVLCTNQKKEGVPPPVNGNPLPSPPKTVPLQPASHPQPSLHQNGKKPWHASPQEGAFGQNGGGSTREVLRNGRKKENG